MKKHKLFDIINLICLCVMVYEFTIILCLISTIFFQINQIFFISLVPAAALHEVLRIFFELFIEPHIINIFLTPLICIFAAILELFLIIEKVKFNNYFFTDFSEKTRCCIFRFSIIGFIVSIIFSYLSYLVTIF